VKLKDTSNATKRSRDFQQLKNAQDEKLNSKDKHRMAKLGLQAAGVAWLSSLCKDNKELNLLRAAVAQNYLEATAEAAKDPTKVFQRDDTKADHLTALSRHIHVCYVCYRENCAWNYDGKSAYGSRFWFGLNSKENWIMSDSGNQWRCPMCSFQYQPVRRSGGDLHAAHVIQIEHPSSTPANPKDPLLFLASWMPDLESKTIYDYVKLEAVRKLHEIKGVEDMQEMRRTISKFDEHLDALVKIAALPEGFEKMECNSALPSLLKDCKGWQNQPDNIKKQLEDGVTGRWISVEDMPMMQDEEAVLNGSND